MHAAANGYMESCKVLISRGVSVGATSSIGWDAAMYADASGHADIAAYLRSLHDNKVRSALHS